MKKIYIVKYQTGDYIDYTRVNIFATENKKEAQKYVRRFNKILKKWKKYYAKFEDFDYWIKDEHISKFDRWYQLCYTQKAYIEEIEKRF